MKIHDADDANSIQALLEYLNACHDGVIRRISFLKGRSYTDEGDISRTAEMPDDWRTDAARCSIEMEVLLNSYAGAAVKQVVLLQFEKVQSFRFFQERASDYSDIYELVCQEVGENAFEFISRIRQPGQERTDSLQIICSSLTCIELDR